MDVLRIGVLGSALPNSRHGPWTLRAIAAGKHVVTTMRLIDDAYRAAGLLPR